jgi:hypothetical protein
MSEKRVWQTIRRKVEKLYIDYIYKYIYIYIYMLVREEHSYDTVNDNRNIA